MKDKLARQAIKLIADEFLDSKVDFYESSKDVGIVRSMRFHKKLSDEQDKRLESAFVKTTVDCFSGQMVELEKKFKLLLDFLDITIEKNTYLIKSCKKSPVAPTGKDK